MDKKSIIEQALLQVTLLEDAVKRNAKGIMASTLRDELNQTLKEQEEEETKFPEEEVNDVTEQPVDDNDGTEEPDSDSEPETFGEPTDGDDSEEDEIPTDSEDGEDSEEGGEEDGDDSEEGSEEDSDDDDDVLDMTNASDEEVAKVYKAMKPEDGVIVKKDGNKVELNVDGEDYMIKLSEQEENPDDEWVFKSDDESKPSEEPVSDEEETIYEVDLEDEEPSEECTECSKTEEELPEAARTIGFGQRGPQQKTMFKAGRKEINEELETLKKQNAEYKKALVMFKEKLNEVAVFNGNLAYAVKLFTECSTKKSEKLEILKRFDSVSTLTESKTLYNTIKQELDNRTIVNESVVNKITSTPKTSTSNVISESKAYEDDSFKRIKELMKKIKK